MKRLGFILVFCMVVVSVTTAQKKKGSIADDRTVWLEYMMKVARPVISNLAEGKLKAQMPDVLSPTIDNREHRSKVAYLEAFGRTLCGIGPWLNLEGGPEKEVQLRNEFRAETLKAIKNAVDPASPDYMVWKGGQPLVDASFFALGLVRCPWLWEHLDKDVQKRVETELRNTRAAVPVYSNWLLFSSMIEVFFCKYGLDYDPVRIDYGVREFMEHWYVGDGMFSDGMQFHLDYYNSYVIQPYLAATFEVMNKSASYRAYAAKFEAISKRYAEIQERMVNADGSFPVTGRSIVYRGGAFHQLADMASRGKLPASLDQGQVRAALTAVIRKTLDAPGAFDSKGWLNLGLYGNQPGLADRYITTGSLYLCSTIFLPLGLGADAPFWKKSSRPWTSLKVWTGKDAEPDHAMDLK
ncbi:DUF2264 domain-containing protein [Arcticibacter sp. MXS-1]|uniref:DUF2264 domain-containing protein n=1 Tax=Arcticibacter sp. MXS-1 TaxID=3341726 RepID=UPI0035A87D75